MIYERILQLAYKSARIVRESRLGDGVEQEGTLLLCASQHMMGG